MATKSTYVTDTVNVKVTPEEKQAFREAAKADDRKLSAWARLVMLDHLRLRGKPVQE